MIDLVHLCLLSVHLFGMAAVVGTFFVQMRAQSGFSTGLVLGGAIVQLLSGIAMVGLMYASGTDVDHAKIAVKLGVAVAVLVSAVLGRSAQHRGGRVKTWFHTAGGLATVNVLVATLWH